MGVWRLRKGMRSVLGCALQWLKKKAYCPFKGILHAKISNEPPIPLNPTMFDKTHGRILTIRCKACRHLTVSLSKEHGRRSPSPSTIIHCSRVTKKKKTTNKETERIKQQAECRIVIHVHHATNTLRANDGDWGSTHLWDCSFWEVKQGSFEGEEWNERGRQETLC